MQYCKIKKGKVVQTETVGKHKGLALVVNGEKRSSKTDSADYIVAGWRPLIIPSILSGQYLGDQIIEKDRVTYAVKNKTPAELAAELEANIKAMREALVDFLDSRIWPGASALIFDNAKGNKPKSIAIKEWTVAAWTEYASRRAALQSGVEFNESYLDFSVLGDIPADPIEAMTEQNNKLKELEK